MRGSNEEYYFKFEFYFDILHKKNIRSKGCSKIINIIKEVV